MNIVKENAIVGIATKADLSDVWFGPAWNGLGVKEQDRIHPYSRLDGAEWFVYKLDNLFLLVADYAFAG